MLCPVTYGGSSRGERRVNREGAKARGGEVEKLRGSEDQRIRGSEDQGIRGSEGAKLLDGHPELVEGCRSGSRDISRVITCPLGDFSMRNLHWHYGFLFS